jgi:hypothetical protein
MISWSDSIIESEFGDIDGLRYYDLITNNTYNETYSRMRYILAGDELYVYWFMGSLEELKSDFTERSLSSFRVKAKSNFDPYTSKIDAIITNLTSTDSVEVQRAKGALSYYDFTDEDLPKLLEAIKSDYEDDTTMYGIKGKLIDAATALDNPDLVPVLSELYKNETTTTVIQQKVLKTLIDQGEKGLDVYLELLPSLKGNNPSYAWSTFTPFYDSLNLVCSNLDVLIELSKVDDYRSPLLNTISRIPDTESCASIWEKKKDDIMSLFQLELENYNKKLQDTSVSYAYFPIYNYGRLAKVYPDWALNDQLTNDILSGKGRDYIKEAALSIRIECNLDFDKAYAKSCVKREKPSYDVAKALYSKDFRKLLPKKYRKAEGMLSLHALDYLNEQEEYPSRVEFVQKMTHFEIEYWVMKEVYINEEKEENNYLCLISSVDENDLKFDDLIVQSTMVKFDQDWEMNAQSYLDEQKNKE